MNNATKDAIARLATSAWLEETVERLTREIESASEREYEVAAWMGEVNGNVDAVTVATAVHELIAQQIIEAAPSIVLADADLDLSDRDFVTKYAVVSADDAAR